jgi:Helix-hairpin-helix motif
MKRIIFIFFIIFTFTKTNFAQNDSLQGIQDVQNMVEDIIQNSADDTPFDLNTSFENLNFYLKHPLNINEATKEDLESLHILSAIQVEELITYRIVNGSFIAIYELQSLPSWDLKTIKTLQSFLTTDTNPFFNKTSLRNLIFKGTNDLFLRIERIMETKKGYTTPDTSSSGIISTRYKGNPLYHYLRFRHTNGTNLSYGFTAEKDAGEEFFKGSNTKGFDYYSAHFYLKNFNTTFKTIALGDYKLNLGQGLIHFNNFANGKGFLVMNLRKNGATIAPYTSVNEVNYMRGAATTLSLSKKTELTLFASYKKSDANTQLDTISNGDPELVASSIQLSGFHRTEAEILDRNALTITTGGFSIKQRLNNGHIAINSMYNSLDKPLSSGNELYKLPLQTTSVLFNNSIDYSYFYKNFLFFGETAVDKFGKIATLESVVISLDKKMDISILHRSFSPSYQSLMPVPFAESLSCRNENGIYTGIEIRPNRFWTISAFSDIWSNPWLKFTADAPTQGREFFSRLTYYRKREMEAYVQFRSKTSQINQSGNTTKTNNIIDQTRSQIRLHLSNKLTKTLELRNRVEFSNFESQNTKTKGFMTYQDIIYKPLSSPLSLSMRYTIFDIDDYNSRIYAYEDDVLYSFSIPGFYNKGNRYYIILNYKGIRHVNIEAYWSRTSYTNINTIGSSLEEIKGNTRSEAKIQIKYQF